MDEEKNLHLTYCLNVHAGERFEDQWNAVRDVAGPVRVSLGAGEKPFGLGLRIGAEAAKDLAGSGTAPAFARWCRERGFYVFTVNAFPFGAFHAEPVKASVYRPDWTSRSRLDYTCAVADLLAGWLPEGVEGSISTVPLWYAPDCTDPAAYRDAAAAHLIACTNHLEGIYERSGKQICLAIEPEPWCALETTDHTLDWFAYLFSRDDGGAVRRRIGVCLDTCHCALAFESPADAIRRLTAAGIRIAKIQLSAALAVSAGGAETAAALDPFAEPVYFHQTARRSAGGVRRWPDLPEALTALRGESASAETRVHFHVPLQWPGGGIVASTRSNMDGDFWALIRSGVCSHLEIETYTFDVLPPALRDRPLASSIEAEYRWVKEQLSAAGGS